MNGPLRFEHPASASATIVDADSGLISISPPRKKLLVVGYAPHVKLAPFEDPDYLVAGLNLLWQQIPRADVWFEMHRHRKDWSDADDAKRGVDYVGWLRTCPLPIFMVERQPDIPTSVRFPIERMGPRHYFQSSIAYMVAWGLAEGFEEIAVYGVDCVGDGLEYLYQKCNLEYWLGVADARGVRLRIPDESALLKGLYRYGYDEPPAPPAHLAAKRTRLEQLLRLKARLQRQADGLAGALAETRYDLNQGELAERGVRADPRDGDWTPNFGIPDEEEDDHGSH